MSSANPEYIGGTDGAAAGAYLAARTRAGVQQAQATQRRPCADRRHRQEVDGKTPVKFIELTDAPPVSPSGCRLSLRSPDGQRLQLEMATGAAAEVLLSVAI